MGATDWCTHPADLDLPRVGGTKWPDLAAIRALGPDLVVANAEENRPEDLTALRRSGISVWVNGPATVAEAIASLASLVRVLARDEPEWLGRTRDVWETMAEPTTRRHAVIPIWRRPWMVLGRDTFAGDLLRRLGVDNVFAHDPERYPKVKLDDPRIAAAELVVLPDEPYAFSAHDGPEEFPTHRSAPVSGRHLTWYGPSLLNAPAILRAQLDLDE